MIYKCACQLPYCEQIFNHIQMVINRTGIQLIDIVSNYDRTIYGTIALKFIYSNGFLKYYNIHLTKEVHPDLKLVITCLKSNFSLSNFDKFNNKLKELLNAS